MVTYQFEVSPDVWSAWKRTVPRDQSLDERIRELLVADTTGGLYVTEPDLSDEAELNSQAKLSLGPSNGGRPIRYAIEFLDK